MNIENYRQAIAKKKTFNRTVKGYASLRSADLRSADLNAADLRGADLFCADLEDANLSDANLSGAIGLLVASDFLEKNFKFEKNGSMIAYKVFGKHFDPLPGWKIEANSIIVENCNPCRTTSCGSGINLAKSMWGGFEEMDIIWKVRIRPEWLGGVVVPYHTDGRIRCEKCELIEISSINSKI